MADAQAKFLTGSLFRHASTMALTSSIGLMAIFFVDFVDMIFIAMLGKAELAAAVGYAGTILFFTTSFGIGMAIASGAVVARALGQGDTDLARERTTHSLVFGSFFGILFVACVWLNLRQFVLLLGATGDTADLAVSFLQIVVPSLPFLIVGMMASAVLRSHGDARRAMMATIYGGVVNAALDPVLIFALDLELTGAALASVAARLVIAVTAVMPLLRHYGGFGRPSFQGLRRDFRPVASIAFPAILTQLATPVGLAFVTRSMAQFGEDAVAGMAIVGRLSPVAFAVVFSLSGAIGPIIGQNFGAGALPRVRRAFNAGVLFDGIVILIVSGLLFLLRAPIADIFTADGVTRDLIYLFCGPLSLLFFFVGVLFVSNATFNNLGWPFYSTFLNWGRNTIATVPLVMLGAHFWGAAGVLVGQAGAGIVFGILAWWLAYRVIERGGRPEGASEAVLLRRFLSLLHLRR